MYVEIQVGIRTSQDLLSLGKSLNFFSAIAVGLNDVSRPLPFFRFHFSSSFSASPKDVCKMKALWSYLITVFWSFQKICHFPVTGENSIWDYSSKDNPDYSHLALARQPQYKKDIFYSFNLTLITQISVRAHKKSPGICVKKITRLPCQVRASLHR